MDIHSVKKTAGALADLQSVILDPNLREATSEELRLLFSPEGFKKHAFRLETFDQYKVPEEEEDFARFLSGESESLDKNQEWCQFIRAVSAQGKIVERVHVIPRVLTDYLRYEVEWGYRYSELAGEQIRLLYRDQLPAAKVTSDLFDFWLFDNKTLLVMDYDHDGSFKGTRITQTEQSVLSATVLTKRILDASFQFSELKL